MKKILTTALTIAILSANSVYAQTVIFNQSSKIYHKTNCHHAIRCKSCIKIEKQEAIKQGGRPCKTCGG